MEGRRSTVRSPRRILPTPKEHPMTNLLKRRRLALAGVLAAAAIGSAAPAAAHADAPAERCEVRLERLVDQFYDMADRRSYEDAVEWWDERWHAYFQSCVI
jgi:hypothetical protein